MREGLSRPVWLVLVITAFCLPLFVGLGRTDLENDEAIYSFAVDEIVANGDWLNPRSSPNEAVVFLEKPPLKFWIVAVPIRLGLLPHDEFGLRFWDALFGGAAFLYVFAIGRRLAGSVCGFVAVMVLFVYQPLLFDHGLRSNNMEAPLVLSYCGAIYHYLRWMDAPAGRRWPHAVAVGLLFFLGFMTKFVAALFLPAILVVVSLAHPEVRRRAAEDWRVWAAVGGMVVALVVPWFVYQHIVSGAVLWETMFGAHVYLRFTEHVDPSHVEPWHFYFTRIWTELQRSGIAWLSVAGAVLLITRSFHAGWLDGILIFTWFALPLALMSLGTSKLHHYAYPFLPPVAIAAGYGPAWLIRGTRPHLVAALDALHRRMEPRLPRPVVRTALLALAVAAVLVSLWTLVIGPFRLRVGSVVVFRNSDLFRPLVVALILGVLAGRGITAARVVIPLLVLMAVLPLQPYRGTLARLPIERHPLRTARECLVRVRASEREAGRDRPGVYAPLPERLALHSYAYYLRRAGGWEPSEEVDQRAVAEGLFTHDRVRPIIISEVDYAAFRQRHTDMSPVPLQRYKDVLLLTPGPYAECSPGAGATPRSW